MLIVSYEISRSKTVVDICPTSRFCIEIYIVPFIIIDKMAILFNKLLCINNVS